MNFLINYIPKLVGAIIIWILGVCIINKILGVIKYALRNKKYNPTLNIFLVSLFGWMFKILLFFVIIDKLGVNMLTFASIITGVSVGVGLAMQGAFANFAGGVLIMIFKPFLLGDLIKCSDEIGYV